MWRLLMNAVVKTGGKEYRISQGGSHPSGKDGRKSRGSGDDERCPDDI